MAKRHGEPRALLPWAGMRDAFGVQVVSRKKCPVFRGRALQPGRRATRGPSVGYSDFTRQNIGETTVPSVVWNTPGVTVLVNTRVHVLTGEARSWDCRSTN